MKTSVIVVLMLASALCGGSACRRAEPDRSPQSTAAAVPVTTAVASTTARAERLEAGGVIAAGASAAISSRIVAPVIEVRVRAGQRVRTGDVLVVLDDRDAAARARGADASATAAEQALSAAESELAAATAEQTLATAWHGRVAALQVKGSATTQELDEATARLARTRAGAQGAQARIAEATSRVAAARAASEAATTASGFATLRAPFDGIVTETMTDPGDLAAPGAPLLRIDAAGQRRVEARVDEARAPFLRVGDRVDVLLDDGSGERTLTGSIVEVARAVSVDERAFMVKVALPAVDVPVSGTFARIRFRGAVRQALIIPASAVRREGQLATAFVLEKDVARLRLLRIGAVSDGQVEVLAGLDGGETVVVNPPATLLDGARVIHMGHDVPAGAAR